MDSQRTMYRSLGVVSLLGLLGGCLSDRDTSRNLATKTASVAGDRLTVDLRIAGRPLRVGFEKSAPKMGDSYKVWTVDGQGGFVETTREVPDCFYEGQVRDQESNDLLPDAYAAVSTCIHPNSNAEPSLYGLIYVNGRHFAIEPMPGDAGASDGIMHQVTPTAQLRFGEPATPEKVIVRLSDVLLPTVAAFREGSELETKYMELIVANDQQRVSNFEGDEEAMLADSIAILVETNVVLAHSGLSPRLRLAPQGQIVLPPGALNVVELGNEVSSEALLDSFNNWSADNLPLHDNHVLLSGHNFDGGTIGLAYLGTICTGAMSGTVVQTVRIGTAAAQVVAHELGHNLGMMHDSDGNDCSPRGNLMAAYAEENGLEDPKFSECSLKSYAALLDGQGAPTCLENVPDGIAMDYCGDALVSGEEECDCGLSDCSAIDPCCDGSTCKLIAGASCSDFNDLCCESCQPASKGTECRGARDECDSAEYCNGVQVSCPGDLFSDAGKDCENGSGDEGACFRGRCMTRTDQCGRWSEAVGVQLEGPDGLCGPQSPGCGELLCHQVGAGAGACAVIGQTATLDGTSCSDGAQCVAGACVYSVEVDQCPGDENKLNPGACGCGIPDVDADLDGTLDCNDLCPEDPQKTEPGDCGCGAQEPNTTGITTCNDSCPTSIEKEAPGICGCETADTDTDVDGMADCIDPCPLNPDPLAQAELGCVAPATGGSTSVSATGGTTSADMGTGAMAPLGQKSEQDKKGCGCRIEAHQTPSSPLAWSLLVGLAFGARLRRRSSADVGCAATKPREVVRYTLGLLRREPKARSQFQ